MTLRGNFSFSLKLLLAKTNMRIKSSITTTTTINYIINSISISRTQPQAFFGFIHTPSTFWSGESNCFHRGIDTDFRIGIRAGFF